MEIMAYKTLNLKEISFGRISYGIYFCSVGWCCWCYHEIFHQFVASENMLSDINACYKYYRCYCDWLYCWFGRGKQVSSNAMLFLKTGVCGGFTTFSTFSLEAVTLFDHEKFVLGGIYIILSVSACIIGVYCGRKIATMML